MSEAVRQAELDFTIAMLRRLTNNESAWNYLRGIANTYPGVRVDIRNKCDKLVSETEGGSNALAISLLADLWEMDGSKSSLETAVGLFTLLMGIDKIRQKSWIRRRNRAILEISSM